MPRPRNQTIVTDNGLCVWASWCRVQDLTTVLLAQFGEWMSDSERE